MDERKEIELLTQVVQQTAEKLKEMVESNSSSVPPMTIMVLKDRDDSGVSLIDEGDEKTIHRVYAGLAIFDPDEKEFLITKILEAHPMLKAYGVIIHADTYEVRKEDTVDVSPEDYERLKKLSTPSEALVGTVVEPEGSRVVAYHAYSRRSDGTIKWEDKTKDLQNQAPGNSVKSNPSYHRPFITEKDFE